MPGPRCVWIVCLMQTGRRRLRKNAWREGLIVNIFKKGDREDPANYRGITLLSVVGKVFL